MEENVKINPEPPKSPDITMLDDPDLFPEGGFKANMVLIGSFCGFIASLSFINSSGVLQSYLLEHRLSHVPTSTIGWIFSINSFLEFGSLLVIGPIFDRVGARIPFTIGIVLSTVGYLCSSWAYDTYQFILSYGILGGLGSSFIFCLSIGVLSHWFNRRRGLAIGLTYIGGALGGALFPIMYRELFPKIGYGWTVRVATFITTGLLLVAFVLARDRREVFVKKPAVHHNDNESESESDDPAISSSIIMDILKSIDVRAFKEKIYTCVVLSLLGQGFAFLLTLTYLSSYSVAQGNPESKSYLLILTFNCLSMPGRVIPGFLADHYGRFNVLCIICVCSLIAILVLWINPYVSHTLPGLFVFAGVYGFTSGSTLSLAPACIGQISKTEDFAKRTGTAFFVFSFGDLIGLPIGGAIAHGTHDPRSYDNLVIFVAAMAAAGTAGALYSRYLYVGFKTVRV